MFSEVQIQCVMHDTGMDRLQAIRHLQAKQTLAELPYPFPLGKNGMADSDAEYALCAQRHPELLANRVR